jgi:molybdopterin-biosynthesis enzyme MoeA-like protein
MQATAVRSAQGWGGVGPTGATFDYQAIASWRRRELAHEQQEAKQRLKAIKREKRTMREQKPRLRYFELVEAQNFFDIVALLCGYFQRTGETDKIDFAFDFQPGKTEMVTAA